MGFAALIFAATVVVSGPSGEPVDSLDRAAQIRCRPAPYHVAEKGERQKLQKTILTGSRVPIRRGYERRARPCHLMHAPMIPQGFGPLKVAD